MSLGIYIQVPFCQTKCTYCNFHTGAAARSFYTPYARAVEREIGERASLYFACNLAGDSAFDLAFDSARDSARGLDHAAAAAAEPVDTIYIGGGTPSLLDPADLAAILHAVHEHFACAPATEITLEADPETISSENAGAWREAGVNRASLGAQSFNDAELVAAGRMHRAEHIGQAAGLLRAAGFANISLDLIAGLPHQTAATWQRSLDEALRLRPEHISIYLLEIDEGSRLGREALAGGSRYGAGAIPDDDSMAELYERACAQLAAAGYEHYEISNWALPGFRSRHNLKYWRREPYLGFGAGAHSFDGAWRWANAHDPAAYVAAIASGRLPIEQHEEVTARQALDEEMFLGLRQLEGIDAARIEKQYGVELGPRLEALRAQGLLEREGGRVRLAPARLTVANEVFVALLDSQQPAG